MIRARSLALALLLVTSACVSTENDLSGMGAARRQLAQENAGWTREFLRNRLIVADEVRISGPAEMRTHLATRVDPGQHARVEETTSAGYLQVYRPKSGQATLQMSAYLDKLEIHVLRKLTVLERPGPVNVVVEALGDVYYVDVDAARDERVPSLRLVGEILR